MTAPPDPAPPAPPPPRPTTKAIRGSSYPRDRAPPSTRPTARARLNRSSRASRRNRKRRRERAALTGSRRRSHFSGESGMESELLAAGKRRSVQPAVGVGFKPEHAADVLSEDHDIQFFE